MTRAEARTAIQSLYETAAGAPTTAELNAWIDLDHKKVRRRLAGIAPTLYAVQGASQTISGSTTALTLAADFESLIRLERLEGAEWLPMEVSEELFPHVGDLSFREQGAALETAPVDLSPGTYRVVYLPITSALSVDSGTGGVLLVPAGFEDIIVELGAARARVKLEEDPSAHLAAAERCWKEQAPIIKRRYGQHVRPGLRRVRNW